METRLTSLLQEILGYYQRMNEICEEQLAVLQEDNFARFLELAEKRDHLQQAVDGLQAQIQKISGQNEDYPLSSREEFQQNLAKLSAKHKQIMELFETKFNMLTADLRSLHSQRKIMKSYYGTENEAIALYLDEKK